MNIRRDTWFSLMVSPFSPDFGCFKRTEFVLFALVTFLNPEASAWIASALFCWYINRLWHNKINRNRQQVPVWKMAAEIWFTRLPDILDGSKI